MVVVLGFFNASAFAALSAASKRFCFELYNIARLSVGPSALTPVLAPLVVSAAESFHADTKTKVIARPKLAPPTLYGQLEAGPFRFLRQRPFIAPTDCLPDTFQSPTKLHSNYKPNES